MLFFRVLLFFALFMDRTAAYWSSYAPAPAAGVHLTYALRPFFCLFSLRIRNFLWENLVTRR